MTRIPPADEATLDRSITAVLEAQKQQWGAPLMTHRMYARRPTIYRAVRAMWSGLEASGLIEPRLVALLNRRVAFLNHCEF